MKKITLYEINPLPEQEQYDLTFNQGTFINHYFTDNCKFSLFAVEQFFVEAEYSSKGNKIINKRTFKTGKELLKYSPFKIQSLQRGNKGCKY